MRDGSSDALGPRAPFLSVPAVVGVLTLAILAVSLAILLGPPQFAAVLFAATAVASGEAAAAAPRPLGPLAPYALHVFAHGGCAHLVMNTTALLAFGALVGRRWSRPLLGPLAFLATFFGGAIAGALLEVATAPAEGVVLVGASGGVFALVAGAVAIYRGADGRAAAPWSAAYLTGLAPWIALNLLIAVVGPAAGDLTGGAQVAWGAHLAGLGVGVLVFALLDPVARGR